MELFSRAQFEQWKEQLDYESACEMCALVVQRSVQETLRMLPFVVASLIRQSSELKESADSFYSKNRDLAEHKSVMASAIESVQSEYPGALLEDVLEQAAVIARKQIKQIRSSGLSGKPEQSSIDARLGVL